MSLSTALRTAASRIRGYVAVEDPVTALRRIGYDARVLALKTLWDVVGEDPGESIFEREWDVLVVLDACRPDVLAEVADDYPFVADDRTAVSLGSNSGQWMARNFGPEYADEMADTAVVTANPHSAAFLDGDDLALLDEVWRYAWQTDAELFRAEYVTDRAIDVWREAEPDRMIVHYMQPHLPFIPEFDGFQSELHRSWLNQWRDVRIGAADREEMWAGYRDNLRYVLDSVALLLDSVTAERVVLTADHGEAVGEWGLYGHPPIPIRALRDVPWVETTATDTGEYTPAFRPAPEHRPELSPAQRTNGAEDRPATRDGPDREEQLRKLGYLPDG